MNPEPAMNDDSSSSTGTLLLAFAGGALLGAGLALLFAPQAGRKTRRLMNELAEDAEDRAREMAEEAAQAVKDVRQKGGQWVEQAKDYVDDKKAQAAAALDGLRR
jgi:gas vesicle protein